MHLRPCDKHLYLVFCHFDSLHSSYAVKNRTVEEAASPVLQLHTVSQALICVCCCTSDDHIIMSVRMCACYLRGDQCVSCVSLECVCVCVSQREKWGFNYSTTDKIMTNCSDFPSEPSKCLFAFMSTLPLFSLHGVLYSPGRKKSAERQE